MNKQYEDVLHFNQKQILVLNEKQTELIRDPQYAPITRVLRSGPLTVQEITEEYNKLILMNCQIDNEDNGNFEKLKRSEKSIYRYLRDLEESGLVTVAGQRVIFGQTATQKLWSRTAKIFVFKTQTVNFWKTEEGLKYAEKINDLLHIIFEDYDKECKYTQELLIRLNKIAEESILNIFTKNPKKIDEIIGGCDFEDLNHILKELHLLILLLKKDEVEALLQSCFG
ncbi:MAG: hypothetical protein ACTSRR_07760 [Candidatus Heimdallarchaeaceae archaeon]